MLSQVEQNTPEFFKKEWEYLSSQIEQHIPGFLKKEWEDLSLSYDKDEQGFHLIYATDSLLIKNLKAMRNVMHAYEVAKPSFQNAGNTLLGYADEKEVTKKSLAGLAGKEGGRNIANKFSTYTGYGKSYGNGLYDAYKGFDELKQRYYRFAFYADAFKKEVSNLSMKDEAINAFSLFNEQVTNAIAPIKAYSSLISRDDPEVSEQADVAQEDVKETSQGANYFKAMEAYLYELKSKLNVLQIEYQGDWSETHKNAIDKVALTIDNLHVSVAHFNALQHDPLVNWVVEGPEAFRKIGRAVKEFQRVDISAISQVGAAGLLEGFKGMVLSTEEMLQKAIDQAIKVPYILGVPVSLDHLKAIYEQHQILAGHLDIQDDAFEDVVSYTHYTLLEEAVRDQGEWQSLLADLESTEDLNNLSVKELWALYFKVNNLPVCSVRTTQTGPDDVPLQNYWGSDGSLEASIRKIIDEKTGRECLRQEIRALEKAIASPFVDNGHEKEVNIVRLQELYEVYSSLKQSVEAGRSCHYDENTRSIQSGELASMVSTPKDISAVEDAKAELNRLLENQQKVIGKISQVLADLNPEKEIKEHIDLVNSMEAIYLPKRSVLENKREDKLNELAQVTAALDFNVTEKRACLISLKNNQNNPLEGEALGKAAALLDLSVKELESLHAASQERKFGSSWIWSNSLDKKVEAVISDLNLGGGETKKQLNQRKKRLESEISDLNTKLEILPPEVEEYSPEEQINIIKEKVSQALKGLPASEQKTAYLNQVQKIIERAELTYQAQRDDLARAYQDKEAELAQINTALDIDPGKKSKILKRYLDTLKKNRNNTLGDRTYKAIANNLGLLVEEVKDLHAASQDWRTGSSLLWENPLVERVKTVTSDLELGGIETRGQLNERKETLEGEISVLEAQLSNLELEVVLSPEEKNKLDAIKTSLISDALILSNKRQKPEERPISYGANTPDGHETSLELEDRLKNERLNAFLPISSLISMEKRLDDLCKAYLIESEYYAIIPDDRGRFPIHGSETALIGSVKSIKNILSMTQELGEVLNKLMDDYGEKGGMSTLKDFVLQGDFHDIACLIRDLSATLADLGYYGAEAYSLLKAEVPGLAEPWMDYFQAYFPLIKQLETGFSQTGLGGIINMDLTPAIDALSVLETEASAPPTRTLGDFSPIQLAIDHCVDYVSTQYPDQIRMTDSGEYTVVRADGTVNIDPNLTNWVQLINGLHGLQGIVGGAVNYSSLNVVRHLDGIFQMLGGGLMLGHSASASEYQMILDQVGDAVNLLKDKIKNTGNKMVEVSTELSLKTDSWEYYLDTVYVALESIQDAIGVPQVKGDHKIEQAEAKIAHIETILKDAQACKSRSILEAGRFQLPPSLKDKPGDPDVLEAFEYRVQSIRIELLNAKQELAALKKAQAENAQLENTRKEQVAFVAQMKQKVHLPAYIKIEPKDTLYETVLNFAQSSEELQACADALTAMPERERTPENIVRVIYTNSHSQTNFIGRLLERFAPWLAAWFSDLNTRMYSVSRYLNGETYPELVRPQRSATTQKIIEKMGGEVEVKTGDNTPPPANDNNRNEQSVDRMPEITRSVESIIPPEEEEQSEVRGDNSVVAPITSSVG